jgi:hypothetical protein
LRRYTANGENSNELILRHNKEHSCCCDDTPHDH